MRLPNSVAATLESGGIVLASSPRAARFLMRLYGEEQHTRGLVAWQSPEILDWDAWLDRLWQKRLREGSDLRLLLTPLQEHQVWVRLIKPSIEGQHLISTQGVAELAQEAYALLCDYEARDFLGGERLGGPDVESFREWARGFERECRREEWLSRSLLPRVLRDAVLAGRVDLPAKLTLTGFDRITPAQKLLIAALEARGCTVVWLESESGIERTELLLEGADTRSEITACAGWARHALRTAAEAKRKARLAVIVPDVRRMRPEMERIFRQVLAPQSIAVGARDLPLPFEFSLGVPLAEVPMLRAALLLLRWMDEAIGQEELTWLLLSGFLWRDQAEFLPAAIFDAKMQKEDVLPPERELHSFLRQSRAHRSDALAGLQAARNKWREAAGEKHSFSAWTERAEQILEAAHWPGVHPLRSEDFQARRKWAQLLDSIAMLAFDGGRVSYSDFREVLERQASRTVFAPESQDVPVQILGPFEAAGMEFDAVWFLGADDASWPPPARPHPFLTRAAQKQHGMPHADSDADWQMTKRVTERIQSNAASCVFSYAAQDKNGPCRPSTVLGRERPALDAMAWLADLTGEARGEDGRQFLPLVIEEEPAEGLRWPTSQDAGGYSTLKMQAACPFQAFATMRLGAKEIRRADWGLDPLDRGNVLHKILEDLWAELQDRDIMIAASEAGNLHEIVHKHVGLALAKYRVRDQGQSWSIAYLAAEQERLCKLVEEWLACEEKRVFFTVEQREQRLSAQVGELKLKLKADRIDTVEGGRLLIDYKSGKIRAAAWEGERPDEPQMPLYAVYGNVPEVRGVLLAQVRAGEVKFQGQVEDAEARFMKGNPKAGKTTPFSEETRQRWGEVLLALGRQFVNGEAQVDPKQYPGTCKFCALPGLCRVAETDRPWTEDEPEGSNGGSDD